MPQFRIGDRFTTLSTVVFLYACMNLATAQTSLQLSISPVINRSDYGDISGKQLSVSLDYRPGHWVSRVSLALSAAASQSFTEDELRNVPGLFIRDEWLENFPSLSYGDEFDNGIKRFVPSTNFQQEWSAKFHVGYVLPVLANFEFVPMIGGGVGRIKYSYIAVYAQNVDVGPLLDFNGALTAPAIFDWLYLMLDANVDLMYKLSERTRVGITGSAQVGEVFRYAYGLRLSATL